MKTILWDLDGTLIDVRKRLYFLFCELTGSQMLDYEKYWEYKNKGFSQRRMLQEINYKGDKKIFHNIWLKNIERKELLQEDILVDGVKEVLEVLNNRKYNMYIVTNRQKYKALVEQLQNLGIYSYFRGVISTLQKCSKAEAVLKKMKVCKFDLFIGDSMEDVLAAKDLGIQSVLIIKENILDIHENERPCYMVKTILEIPLLLERIG